MIADGQSKLETDRLLELGRFMHRRLRENGAWKTYGCVFLDMRAQTINAAMRYLSDYFAQSDGTIYQKKSVPKKLVEIYSLEPAVADVFNDFLEHESLQPELTKLRPTLA
jgi:hypothetical protein